MRLPESGRDPEERTDLSVQTVDACNTAQALILYKQRISNRKVTVILEDII